MSGSKWNLVYDVMKHDDFSGRNCYSGSRIVRRFGTSAAAEEIISPSVQVSYTQLLIDGNFVDSASGD